MTTKPLATPEQLAHLADLIRTHDRGHGVFIDRTLLRLLAEPNKFTAENVAKTAALFEAAPPRRFPLLGQEPIP